MSLLIGDDYPEAVDPHDGEKPAPAGAPRRRPAAGGKRRDWPRWRANRPRSMLIQDAPDPAEDGAGDDYGDGDVYADGNHYDAGDPYPANGFWPGAGYGPGGYPQDYDPYDGYPGDRIGEDRYPESGYAEFPDSGAATLIYRNPGHADPGHGDSGYTEGGYPGSRPPGSGYPDSVYPSSGYSGSWYSGHAPYQASDRETWPRLDDDGFRAPLTRGDYPWDNGGEDQPALDDEPSVQRFARPGVLFLHREARNRDGDGSRKFVSSAQRLGGLLLAGASVIGVAVYVPSILAADRGSFTGVVSSSGVASLNFGAAGRVGSVRVRLGQVVRKGQVLATEAGAAMTAALRADRAAITADKANLAALQADGAAAASIAAAQARLAKDRAHRDADQAKLAAAEIVAPQPGTVVAINGQPGESVGRTGLSGSAAHAQTSPRQQQKFSLLPSGPMSSLRAAAGTLPVIALRTGGGWQVRLLIPQTDTSAVKAGEDVTISVPAAQLGGVKGTIAELSPLPVSNSGGAAYEAVVQVLGRIRITPLTGMTANVQLGPVRLRGRAAPVTAHG